MRILPCAYRDAALADPPPPVAPRPWRLELRYDRDRRLTAMEVRDAEGGCVEHRLSSGFLPADFARHVVNAAAYVAAVNGRAVE